MAIATWPTRTDRELPSVAHASGGPPSTRMTARSVSASRPTRSARIERPSGSITARRVARSTTWLLVRTKPSGVNTTPDPPARSTSIFTTAGPTVSTARTTAFEYESSSSSSSGAGRGDSAITPPVYEGDLGRCTTRTGGICSLGYCGPIGTGAPGTLFPALLPAILLFPYVANVPVPARPVVLLVTCRLDIRIVEPVSANTPCPLPTIMQLSAFNSAVPAPELAYRP